MGCCCYFVNMDDMEMYKTCEKIIKSKSKSKNKCSVSLTNNDRVAETYIPSKLTEGYDVSAMRLV